MHVSPAIVARALVMFACLVALPLYALLETSLPQKLIPMIDQLWAHGQEAKQHSPLRGPDAGVLAPRDVASEVPAESESGPLRSPNRRVSYEPPLAPPGTHRTDDAGAVIHAGGPPPSDVSGPDEFSVLERSLCELGASSFSLEMETRADRPARYWFSCRVAHYFGRFEASAPSAPAAMSNVLDQVRSWRAERVARLP